MILLEYAEWRNFENILEKAKLACANSEQAVTDHFVDVNKMVEIGSGTQRTVKDYKLSRYACYLIAQNGDPEKESIALAQTYFAIQTRKQEVFESMTDDKKRLLIRDEVTDHNKRLFRTAQDHGVRNFGRFNDAGYKGLYGMNAKEIRQNKNIGVDNILDRAGATELAANLFRITQTDEQLQERKQNDGSIGEDAAAKTHFVVGGKVRKAIKDIGGAMPEKLPPHEHIKVLQKKVGGYRLPGTKKSAIGKNSLSPKKKK